MRDSRQPPEGQRREKQPPPSGAPKPPRPRRRRRPSGFGRWSIARTLTVLVLASLLVVVLWNTMSGRNAQDKITYSALTKDYIEPERVASIRVIGDRLDVMLKPSADGISERKTVSLGPLEVTPTMVDGWTERGINVELRPSSDAWRTVLNALPYVAILVIIFFLFRQAQGGQRGVFSFGKSRARELTEDVPTITFNEVAGAEEAKQELQEIIEFLKEPEKFQRLGGKIPRGVLMVGPPGTGKTYLARAVAGEASVPFFTISGSDFVEMFVGVGASRVRDLFERAKVKAPCIIFVDEIDAVGRHRGAGLGGGHDEREQTLNQLLVEMDGFNSSATVILIAATNRPDVLDPALLRPGRFDRQVVIDMPDVRGREGILRIHTRKVILAADVDLGAIAKGTPGLSGADLQNLVNESALLSARRNRSEVGMAEFEAAKEKVMWGAERRSLVMSDEERRITAVHEAGHALATISTPGSDPVHKVSIIPHGRALGLTAYLPDAERHTIARSWCTSKLVGILGGRAAEGIVFGEVTNGAANDLDVATVLARRMVCEWGMSDRFGLIFVGQKNEEVFIGRELVQSRALSERTLQIIDDEVRRLLDDALKQAQNLLEQRRTALDALAGALLVREVLDRSQIDRIIQPYVGVPATVETAEREGDGPRKPVVLERPASSPASGEPKREDAHERAARELTHDRQSERRSDRHERPHREETRPETATGDSEKATEPTRRLAETGRRPDTPEPAQSRPMAFGRKLKVVKRFGLPSSQVPQSGIPVSTLTSGGAMVYGRPLRSADEDDDEHKSDVAKPDSASSPGEPDGAGEAVRSEDARALDELTPPEGGTTTGLSQETAEEKPDEVASDESEHSGELAPEERETSATNA